MIDLRNKHPDQPSAWVRRFAPLIAPGGTVLDVACGSGRHARYFAGLGHPVDAVDRDAEGLAGLAAAAGVTTRQADLENAPWPFAGRRYAGIVVANYLHRPLFPHLVEALAEGGVLIYETFMVGNERFGRPSNPDFLLQPGELLGAFLELLSIVAFEQGEVAGPKPAMVQRLCALKGTAPIRLPSGGR